MQYALLANATPPKTERVTTEQITHIRTHFVWLCSIRFECTVGLRPFESVKTGLLHPHFVNLWQRQGLKPTPPRCSECLVRFHVSPAVLSVAGGSPVAGGTIDGAVPAQRQSTWVGRPGSVDYSGQGSISQFPFPLENNTCS